MPKNELEKPCEHTSAFLGWLAESWETMKDMGQELKMVSAAEKKRFAVMVMAMIVATALLGGCDDIEASRGTSTGDPGYRETPTWVASSTEVYVSRTPTPEATRTLTQTPTVVIDTATATVTATPTSTEGPEAIVWGSVDLSRISGITAERAEELASMLPCGCECAYGYYDFTDSETDRRVVGVSTGEVISIRVNNELSGDALGVVDAAEFISRGQGGGIFSVWIVMQTRPAGSLNTDVRANFAQIILEDYSRTTDDIYSLEELKTFLSRNLVRNFSFSSRACLSRMNDQEEEICLAVDSLVPGNTDSFVRWGVEEDMEDGILIFPIGVRSP